MNLVVDGGSVPSGEDPMGTETFQIGPEAAELYEAEFVPAIFAEWAPRLVAAAGVGEGDHVADIACGTGIVARHARAVVGPTGTVVGVDLNPAMLAVADRVTDDVELRQGDAADLPLADGAVDVALCQMALMFMPDRAAVVAEMARVARRTVGLLVPASIEDQPAYGRFTDVVTRHAGEEGAAMVGAYWSAGDPVAVRRLLADAGLEDGVLETAVGTASFASIDALVATEVEGSPLADRIDAATYEAIRVDCRDALAPWTTDDGRCEAPLTCHLAVAHLS